MKNERPKNKRQEESKICLFNFHPPKVILTRDSVDGALNKESTSWLSLDSWLHRWERYNQFPIY